MRLSTKEISGMIFCAALYAVGSFVTAYIQSPWGFGQFRPAVVIPAVFSIVFGPWTSGVGAAMGTLICDSIKHGQFYIPSLTAAVPGNFIRFFMLGKLLQGKFSWRRFVIVTMIILPITNAIVAFLYVPTIYLLGFLPKALAASDLLIFATALTVWWFVTMLPFMLLFTPPLTKAVCSAVPSLVPQDVRSSSLKSEISKPLFALSLILPGALLLIIGVLLAFTPLGQILFYGLTIKLKSGYAALSLDAMKVLFLISGITLSGIGTLLIARRT